MREKRIFENERKQYQHLTGSKDVYPMGTFVPADPDTVHQNFVQMVPTENSERMFNNMREQSGDVLFKTSYDQDPTIYMTSGKTSMILINNFFDVNTYVTNLAAEFLDNSGILLGIHTIRLVELTETDDVFYYTLVGGKGMIEAKADEMYNSESVSYEGEPFVETEDNQVQLNPKAIIELAMSMANDIFGRNWTEDDLVRAQNIYGINSPHGFDMGENDRWVPLDQYNNWTSSFRIGVAFAITKA